MKPELTTAIHYGQAEAETMQSATTLAQRQYGAARVLALSIGALLLTACSHTPSKPSEPKPSEHSAAISSTAAPATAPAPIVNHSVPAVVIPPTDDEVINQSLRALLDGEEHEPSNSKEAVAAVVAEQNLINRIRTGFVLQDADHVNVDREVAWFIRHPDYLDRTFRRAERYLYFIAGELEARKMPLELALLPLVESAFNPVALSKARAAGLWQFIPSTGRRYGLEQNHTYDGRRDIVESTRAALDYFQFLANEFNGDWYQAIAAYNAGEANVSRAITRNTAHGKPTDFFSLELPRETRAYVPKLLAIRRIVADPQSYGLEFGHMANQPYFATVELDGPVDLGVAARLAGVSREDLIALNPAYPRAVTSTDGPGTLLVPVESADQLRDGLAKLTPAQRLPRVTYVVHRGDTLSSAAKTLHVSVEELRTTNKLKNNTVHVGQELFAVRGSLPATLAKILEPTESSRMVSQDPNYVPPPIPNAAPIDTSDSDIHKVTRGETLLAIAQRYGVSTGSLASYNGLTKRSRLHAGQKLVIPGYARRNITTATLATTHVQDATVQRVTYVVKPGDTLHHIAIQYRVQITQLQKWNNMSGGNVIKVGQKLVLFVDDNRGTGG